MLMVVYRPICTRPCTLRCLVFLLGQIWLVWYHMFARMGPLLAGSNWVWVKIYKTVWAWKSRDWSLCFVFTIQLLGYPILRLSRWEASLEATEEYRLQQDRGGCAQGVFLGSNDVLKRREMSMEIWWSNEVCMSPACAQWIVARDVYHTMFVYMVCPARFLMSGVIFLQKDTISGYFFLIGCAHACGWLFTDRGDVTRPPNQVWCNLSWARKMGLSCK